jgi:hypothetical protein
MSVLDNAVLSATISKALPVFIDTFSSFGMCFILSSPKNSNAPSAVSYLNTLMMPLGRGIPKPFY